MYIHVNTLVDLIWLIYHSKTMGQSNSNFFESREYLRFYSYFPYKVKLINEINGSVN